MLEKVSRKGLIAKTPNNQEITSSAFKWVGIDQVIETFRRPGKDSLALNQRQDQGSQ